MDQRVVPGGRLGRAAMAMARIFRDYPGNIAVRLWTGETMNFGHDTPRTTLVFRDPALFRSLVLRRDPLVLAEAYFDDRFDIEGDIYPVLGLHTHLAALSLEPVEKCRIALAALFPGGGSQLEVVEPVQRSKAQWVRRHGHSRRANKKAVAYHYDVSNAFYRLWLDEKMVYSCACFEDHRDSLEQAQCNKLEHICRKLRLNPGERLLDIGCGWGALLFWAAQHHGVEAHGITLSEEQFHHCREEIVRLGLQGRVSVSLRDYRDLEGENRYDKIVSVGMFEHVGLRNLPQYFSTSHRLLVPGGLFLNHGITKEKEGWRKTIGTRFINRYVFPDGELDRVSNVQQVMEDTGFEILDVEALRPHYALTLRNWVARLEERRREALQIVPESTWRVWRLYMAACALQFEQGDVGVYQILVSKRDGGLPQIPLSRRDLYS